MQTDKELYTLFRHNPKLLDDFLHIKAGTGYQLRSESLKQIERRVDGCYESEHAALTYIIEFEGYRNKQTYDLVFAAMALYRLSNPHKNVMGIIMFINEEDDPKIQPWHGFRFAGNDGFRVLYLVDILARLEKEQPNHILLSVFFPLICSDAGHLRKDGPQHYQRIMKESLDRNQQKGVLDAFTSWMLSRLQDPKEIEAMITRIPKLEGSPAAHYFEQRGEKRGEKRGDKRGERRGIINTEMETLEQLKAMRDLGEISDQAFQKLAQRIEQRLRDLEATD